MRRTIASLALLGLTSCALIDGLWGEGAGPTCVQGLPCFDFANAFGVPEQVDAVAIGDVDGDSFADIVLAGTAGGLEQVRVLSGDGTGGFSQDYNTAHPAGQPIALLLFDAHDGGLPDLVVLGENGSLTRMTGDPGDPSGLRTVGSPVYASEDARWLLPIDAVYQDSVPEVAVVSPWGIELYDLLLGTVAPYNGPSLPESGAATVGVYWSSEGPSIALAGLDRTVRWLGYNQAILTWEIRHERWFENMAPGAIATGSLDGDGLDDVVVPLACGSDCNIFAQVYSPSFDNTRDLLSPIPFVPTQLLATQMDWEPGTDVLAVNAGGQWLDPPDLVIAVNRGDHFDMDLVPAEEGPEMAAVGELTGDGLPDIVVSKRGREVFVLPGISH